MASDMDARGAHDWDDLSLTPDRLTPGLLRAIEGDQSGRNSYLRDSEAYRRSDSDAYREERMARARTAKLAAELADNKFLRVRRPSTEIYDRDDLALSPDHMGAPSTPSQVDMMASDVLRAQLDWLDESSSKADETQLADALEALTRAAPGDSAQTAQLREEAGQLIVSQLSEARRAIASLESEARQASAKRRASEREAACATSSLRATMRSTVGQALRETSASKELATQLRRELSLSKQASATASPQPASQEAPPPSPMLASTATATESAQRTSWWASVAALLAIVVMLVATGQSTPSTAVAGGRPALGGLERAQRLRATYTASGRLPIAARLVWASAPDLRQDQF